MRLSLLIQQCLFGMAIVKANGADTSRKLDWDTFEFGRDALLDEFSDAEVRYRDLIEFEIMSLSMSMSMSMDYQKASPTPSTTSEAPEALIPAETPAPVSTTAAVVGDECDEQSLSAVRIFLEVDTAVGKESFSADLKSSLANALSAEYSFCNSRRRLGRRNLQDGSDIQLGQISIFEETPDSVGSCLPLSTVASECHIAQVDFQVSGDDQESASNNLRNSLQSIFENDQAFKEGLLVNGVVDVRLQELVRAPAITAPSLRSGENQDTARPTVVAVLSVAAGTIVAAIALRRFMRRSDIAKHDMADSDDDSFEETPNEETPFDETRFDETEEITASCTPYTAL